MKILIVKVSSLGDVVHAMPVVADILRHAPHAQVDWVAEEAFAGLVGLVRGVRKVIPFALRRWRKAPFAAATRAEFCAYLQAVRAERYDHVLDLQGLVKTAALVAAPARGVVHGLANRTEGSSHEWPVRFFYDRRIAIAPHTHVVTRSRELAAQALGYMLAEPMDFGLDGAAAPQPLKLADPYLAFVHATSRADKCWPDDEWVGLGRAALAAGLRVVLPWGSAAEREVSERLARALGDGAIVPERLSLPQVVGLLHHARATVGVDTGLVHIAAALDRPTVELYNFTTAWRTGGFWSPRIVNLGEEGRPPRLADVREALRALGVF